MTSIMKNIGIDYRGGIVEIDDRATFYKSIYDKGYTLRDIAILMNLKRDYISSTLSKYNGLPADVYERIQEILQSDTDLPKVNRTIRTDTLVSSIKSDVKPIEKSDYGYEIANVTRDQLYDIIYNVVYRAASKVFREEN